MVCIEKSAADPFQAISAGALHDLCDLITSLRIRTTLIRRTPEHINEHLEVLENYAARFETFIKDLMVLSYLSHEDYVPEQRLFDLNMMLEQITLAYSAAAVSKQLTLRFEPEAKLRMLHADPENLDRLVVNLITNAIKYTPPGGSVVIRTHDSGQGAIVIVSDSGIGIDGSALPHIFDPFFRAGAARRMAAGTGLGLTIVKKIVDQHYGTINVETIPNHGTTLRVYIPHSD